MVVIRRHALYKANSHDSECVGNSSASTPSVRQTPAWYLIAEPVGDKLTLLTTPQQHNTPCLVNA